MLVGLDVALTTFFLPTANGTQPQRADVNNSGNIYTMQCSAEIPGSCVYEV